MKNHLLYSSLLILICASCQRTTGDVISETYVHRYGVQLPPQDWSARGQSGQIVSVRKDGVVETRSYEFGILHGECSYSYPHRDTIQYIESYDQGNLVKKINNYPSGVPESQVLFVSPTHEKVTSWYENGAPKSNEDYENGLLESGEYYTYTHEKESIVDSYNGTRVNRDAYGQLLSRDDIQDGHLLSRTTYHSNGAPQSITPYVNGEVQGKRLTYQPTGEPVTIEEWTSGVQHGNTEFYLAGEKISDCPYVNGQKQGVEKRYRDGEVLMEEVNWVQDCRHGPSTSYVGGNPRTDWYFQGRKVSKPAFDALRNQ